MTGTERGRTSPGEQLSAAGILVCEADRPVVAPVVDALRARGLDLPRVTPDGLTDVDVLVVAISSTLMSDPDVVEAIRATSETGDAQIVPLVLEGGPDSELFSDLSQVRLAAGVEDAARILGLVLRVGSQHLVPWRRLTTGAHSWADGGRSRGGLLGRSDARLAVELLAEPIADYDAEGAKALRELVRASRRRHRTVRYAQLSIAAVVAIALLAVGIVAADQQRSAEAARLEANMSAAMSESSRLSDVAITLAGYDPDIPWIIAADANQMSTEPEIATAAAVLVTSAVPAHRSLHLNGVPKAVSVGENGFVAVTRRDDQRLDLMDLKSTDQEVFEDVETGMLSESGTRLALLRPEGDLDVLEQDSAAGWATNGEWHGVQAFDWAQDDLLCVSQGNTLLAVELDTSVTMSWELPESVVPVSAVACDVALLAVLGAGHIATFDPSVLEVPEVVALDGEATAIAVSHGRVLVQYEDRVSLPAGAAANGEIETSSPLMAVVAMVPAGPHWLAVALPSGQIGFLDSDDLSLRSGIDSHRGVAWAVDYSDEWGVISVGADMKLRTWEIDRTSRSIGSDQGVTRRYAQAGFRASFRHQLEATGNPQHVNLTHIDSDMGFVVDRNTLDVISERRISLNWDTTLPTGIEGLFLSVLRDRQEAYLVDIFGSEANAIPFEFRPLPSRMALAANSNASAIAIATNTYLQKWTEPSGWIAADFDEERDLILLEVDDEGGVTTLDSRGIGDGPSGPWVLNLDEAQRLSAIVRQGAGTFIAVDSRGSLLRFAAGEGEELGSVGADADVFDVHVSADGGLVAAIGTTATRFFSIRDGRVIAEMSGDDSVLVVDLIFDEQGSGGIYVRSNGVVGRFDVPEDLDALVEGIEEARPRALTEEEVEMLSEDRSG